MLNVIKIISFFGWMSYNIQSTMSPFEKKVKVLFVTQKEFRFVSLGCIQ